MVYTVRYRDKSGALSPIVLEAADRKALFAELANRGIAAVNVTEGGTLERNAAQGGKNNKRLILTLAALGAIIAIVGFFWQTDAPAKISDASKTIEKNGKTKPKFKKAEIQKTGDDSATVSFPKSAVERKDPVKKTRPQIEPPAPLADIQVKIQPKRLFKTETEQLISMAIPSSPGAGVPPIPFPDGVDFSKDMKKALSSIIKAEENDDENTLEIKLSVAEHKEELAEYAKEGWTVQDYANAIRDKYNEDNDFLAECHEILEKTYSDETVSDEAYLAFKEQINKKLQERGLPELTDFEAQINGDNQETEEKQQ